MLRHSSRPFGRLEPLEPRLVLAAYFVSPTGSDSAAGTSAAPWQTLQHAADQVQAGDVVTVRAGSYSQGFNFWDGVSGTAQNPIIFRADPGVTITGRNVTTADAINIENGDYITVEGFTIRNTGGSITRAGVRAANADHVTIRNNDIDGMGRWGVLTGFCDDLLIEGNKTSHSIAEHGIYVSNSGDRPIIRGNTSFGNRANGIHMNGDVSLGGDGIISGALVENNVIYENGVGGGSGINCDGVQDSRIQNNLLYDNHASGISLYRIDAGGSAINNIVINNTIVNAANSRWAMNIQSGSTGNRLFNNIFYNFHNSRGSIDISSDSLSGFVSDYNVVMDRFTTNGGSSIQTLAQWRTSTGQDQHSIIAIPTALFVSVAGDNYHLSSTSPAINAGTPTFAPASDFEGNARPSGSGWDIGADEFLSGGPPPVSVSTIGLYDGQGGRFLLRNSNSAGPANAVFNYGAANAGWQAIAGDWNGDGVDTVGLYNPSTSTFFLRNVHSAGPAENAFSFGPANSGWLPIAGDWNGDGADTVGLYNPTTGTFFLRNSHAAGGADAVFAYGPGNAGWLPIAGDWNGNGTDTMGLYNPTGGSVFLRNSNSAGVADVSYFYGPANQGWLPMAGDWNGDGSDSVGLYNRSNGGVYLRNAQSAGAADVVFSYGPPNSGWRPLAGDWNGPGSAGNVALAAPSAPGSTAAAAMPAGSDNGAVFAVKPSSAADYSLRIAGALSHLFGSDTGVSGRSVPASAVEIDRIHAELLDWIGV